MKKLMTMLAAAAMAFGLYADPITPISSTSFESAGEFDANDDLVKGTDWTCDDEAATLKKGTYNGDAYVYTQDNVRYSTFGNTQTTYLNVKTAFDKPLKRASAATIGDDAVFFDQLVKFTAADEDMAVDSTAKIAFYVKDLSEAETPAAETNLYVVAGKFVNNVLSPETYNLGAIDVDAWHRLTVKTVKGFDGADLAFEVFLDGVALQLAAPAFDATSAAALSDKAKAINTAKKLFPSRVQNTLAVAGVELAGQGAIDDIMATKEVPGTWAEDKDVTLAWDANVTGFTYTIGGISTTKSGLTAAGSITIPYAGNFDVVLSAMTFADNWGFDTVTCVGACNVKATTTVQFTGEEALATITSKDTTPRVYVGGVAYPSLVAALANTIADGTTITLNADLTGANGVTVDDNGITLAKFKSKGSIVFDLAGHTVGLATGAALTGALLNVNQCAEFTLTDSVGNGCVAGGIKVVNYNGTEFIATGDKTFTVNGKVDVADGATSEIAGGSFDYDTNTDADEFALELKDGFKADHVGAYWVVSEKEKYTLTITETNAKVKVMNGEDEVESGDEVYAGTVLTISAEAEAYYESLTLKVNNEDFTSGGTHTVAADVTVVATASAVEYTLTYTDGADVDPFTKEVKFTKANYTALTLWDGTRDGYTFNDDWANAETLDEVDDTDELLANIKELIDSEAMSLDLTLTGSWTPDATDVTVTLIKGDGIAAISKDSVTGEPGTEVTVTLTAESTIKIPVFKADGFACSASYKVTIPEEDDEITFTAIDATDPAADDDDVAAAIVATGVDLAKVALFPGEAKVFAAWIEKTGATPTAINESNYVKASVDLDVALIDETTPVNVDGETFAIDGSELTFTVKIADVTITSDNIENYVKVTSDVADWTKVTGIGITVNETGVVTVNGGENTAVFSKVEIPGDAE